MHAPWGEELGALDPIFLFSRAHNSIPMPIMFLDHVLIVFLAQLMLDFFALILFLVSFYEVVS